MDGKKIFRSNIVTSGGGLALSDLRTFAKNDPQAFVPKIQGLVDSGKMKLDQMRDLRGLYQYLADIQVPMTMEDATGAKRAISSSAFPILVGTLSIAAIQAAYNEFPAIGNQLVTEMEDPNKVTTIAALSTLDKNIDEVKELQDFPEIGTDEEKVEIRHRKNGRTYRISAEAIAENRIGEIVSKTNGIGQIAARRVEIQTLEMVTDDQGSKSSGAEPYVYRPNGTGTALFSASANTPGVRAPSGTRVNSNAFADDTDLNAARTVLRAMKDNSGNHIAIPWSSVILLVPDAVLGSLLQYVNSIYVPGVENQINLWGAQGPFRIPNERILSTPLLDDLSASAWYMGDFKSQFIRKWKLRFEYVTLGQDTQAYLNSQVAFQARIAWDCQIGAVDYVNVVQSISASTAPGDE